VRKGASITLVLFFLRLLKDRDMRTIEKMLLSVKEIKELTGWSIPHIYRLIDNKQLRAVPTNSDVVMKPIRVEKSELQNFIKGDADV
tara:strand:+ start:276 stop:536 length:261 start_codon:yes stop_codon:yes gene_type:complete